MMPCIRQRLDGPAGSSAEVLAQDSCGSGRSILHHALWFGLLLIFFAAPATAQVGLPAVTLRESGEDTEYVLTLQLLALMTVLSLLPSLLLIDRKSVV